MNDSFTIDLATIPEEGLNITFLRDEAWFESVWPEDDPPDFSVAKLEGHCLVTRSGQTLFIRGNLTAHIRQACSRCLEGATVPIGGEFAYTLIPAETEIREELELTAQDLETSYYSGDIVDLTPMIYEQIILQVPIQMLCDEQCKGLCPRCGANLNTKPCGCPTGTVDPRLAVLKNFKANH